MIFVTVGTHEQPFDRLIRAVDNLAKENVINEKIFIQTGYSNYEPLYCEWSKFIAYDKMKQFMSKSSVVITHGGPSSFIEAMALGKVPVVVPRLAEYGEHINNHQIDFVRFINEHQGGIVPVFNMKDLAFAITEAREKNKQGNIYIRHNEECCKELEVIINTI